MPFSIAAKLAQIVARFENAFHPLTTLNGESCGRGRQHSLRLACQIRPTFGALELFMHRLNR
jgi:hypothetical protein